MNDVVVQQKSLEIGSIMSRSFSLIRSNPVALLGITALCMVPAALISVAAGGEYVGFLASKVLDRILGILAQAAVAYAVFQMFVSYKASLGESFSRGLVRILPLIVLAFLSSLAIVVGYMLLIVPGVILSLMFVVAVPACVVEELGPIDSMKRSVELTKGSRAIIFLLYFVVGIVIFVITLMCTVVLMAITGEMVGGLLLDILIVIPTAFMNVLGAVIYCDLRNIKEGVSIESIVSVFE